jgi:proline iminopeptidase
MMRVKFIGLLIFFTSLQAFAQEGYFIKSKDQTDIFIEEKGTGTPVVLLSGGPGLNPFYVYPIHEQLSKHFRSIILHQRGTGKTVMAKIDSTTLSLDKYVEDLEALRNHLQAKKLILIGQSWGGMLSMEYCSRYPDKVEKLVLVGSGSPSMNFANYFSDNIQMRLRPEDLAEKSGLKRNWIGYFFDRESGLASKAAIDFTKISGQPGINSIMVGDYAAKEKQRLANLKKYKGPAYVIQGYQDPVGFAAYEIKSVIPQAELLFVKQSGHLPWFEKESTQKQFYDFLIKALK